MSSSITRLLMPSRSVQDKQLDALIATIGYLMQPNKQIFTTEMHDYLLVQGTKMTREKSNIAEKIISRRKNAKC